MLPSADPAALRRTKWHEYLIRFVFGGFVTAMAGWIAHQYGPVVGGLFLAFPAIFPASVTLVESHERKKKENDGQDGAESGINASGVDALGAELGSIGLIAFAAIVLWCAPRWPAWAVLSAAAAAWLITSVIAWIIRKRI
jgi:hypothetical protein